MTATEVPTQPDMASARPAPSPGFPAAVLAVARAQVARARVARGPLLFVATLQSLGILLLLRGVVRHGDRSTAAAIVAGAGILVVAFVALNLLAQRFGALAAARALDYYAALPVAPGAVVLGTAAAYAAFTVPGAVLTVVVGALLFGLPLAGVWVAVPAVLAAGVGLSGLGALLGLLAPRPELATVAGQLGMTAVLFLGIVPPAHLPEVLRVVRQLVPSTYATDALAAALRGSPAWWPLIGRLAAATAYGAAALAVSGRALRWAVAR